MSKKGFTLVELLAVIVILAVISLIVTPMILGVIEIAKKGAAESSALGYIDAVEKQMVINTLDSTKTNIVDGVYETDDLISETYGVNIKGEKPSAESWIQIRNNQIVDYSLKIGNYVVNYNETDKKMEVIESNTVEAKPSESSQITRFVPKYFEFGNPTTSSTTDFSTLGKSVFTGLSEDGITKGVCSYDGELFCLKVNDYENSKRNLESKFGDNCGYNESDISCNGEVFNCGVQANGTVWCSTHGTDNCYAHTDRNGDTYCLSL